MAPCREGTLYSMLAYQPTSRPSYHPTILLLVTTHTHAHAHTRTHIWRQAGYFILDGALGGDVAAAIESNSTSEPTPSKARSQLVWATRPSHCTCPHVASLTMHMPTLAGETHRLVPHMQAGRVGGGVDGGASRTDVLWRHRCLTS